jgi:hypothetical protein
MFLKSSNGSSTGTLMVFEIALSTNFCTAACMIT